MFFDKLSLPFPRFKPSGSVRRKLLLKIHEQRLLHTCEDSFIRTLNHSIYIAIKYVLMKDAVGQWYWIKSGMVLQAQIDGPANQVVHRSYMFT